MNRQAEIVLHLDHADQLIEPCPPSPFRRRRLREEAEKFIVQAVRNLQCKTNIKVIIYLPEAETVEAVNISEAFHENFAFRRDEARKQLSDLRRFGLRSLLIAFVFLAVLMLMVQIIRRYMAVGNLSSLFQEGLTILGWVAFWRPGELLLYEWYPFYRNVRIYSKLERAEIQIITEHEETGR